MSEELQQNVQFTSISDTPPVPAGCDDVIRQAADAQRSTSEPHIRSGMPSSSGLAGRGPGAPSSQQTKTGVGADGGDVLRHLVGGRCWEGPVMETRGCVCVYGQREPEGLGPCWSGSPYVYYGGEFPPHVVLC